MLPDYPILTTVPTFGNTLQDLEDWCRETFDYVPPCARVAIQSRGERRDYFRAEFANPRDAAIFNLRWR